jgi:hypothetical protein
MFPNSQHSPAKPSKAGAVAPVSEDVVRNFGVPVATAGAWPPVAFRATVPKAAVHKNGKPFAGENKIRLAGEWRGLTAPLSDPGGYEKCAKFPFS